MPQGPRKRGLEFTMKHPPLPRPKKKPLSKKALKEMYLKAQELVRLAKEDREVF